MNILYFADIRFPLERANGIQTMETCWALAERGDRVSLVVRPDTHVPPRDPFEYYGRPAIDRLTIERAPVGGLVVPRARRLGYLAFAAGRALGAGRPDILMTRDLAVASMLLRMPGRPPIVYESHGHAPDIAAAMPGLLSTAAAPSAWKLARLARREAYVWKHAEGYVTITRGIEEDLTRRFGGRERVAVIPDGARVPGARVPGATWVPGAEVPGATWVPGAEVPGATWVPGARVPGATWVPGARVPGATVAYAGHLYPWKGVDVLIDALARVPEVHGLIIGGHEAEPDLARVRALTAKHAMDERVTFTGQLRPADVQARLAQADILVLPNPASAISTHATSPLKLFEYMAARKAIVASDLPAIREVLSNEVNALLVPPGEPEALAGAIRRLVHDSGLRQRLAEAAHAAVAEYSWERRAERLHALFAQVLAAAAGRRSHMTSAE